jgi:hypothetical protein
MAKGEYAYGGGGRRWRTKAAAAVAEHRSDAAQDPVPEDAGDGEPQAVRSVLRANAEKGYRELADVRQKADLRSGVRGKVRSSKALVAPFRLPGTVVVGTTLNDILPRDLSKVSREDMAESLIHLAKQCEKIGNPAAAAQVMSKAAMVMGLYEEPEAEVAPVDPAESRRRICEAARSYGMIPGPEMKDG